MLESLKIKEVKSNKKNGIEIERITFSDGKIIYRRLDKNTFFPKNISEKYISLAKEYRFRQQAEDEVTRIMCERGYSSERYKNKLNRSKKIDSIVDALKGPILSLLAIVIVVGGGLILIPWISSSKDSKNNNSDNITTAEMSSQEYADYLICMGGIDKTDISYEDEEFWKKYVDRYESMLSCYNQFPNIVNASDKSDLENKISYFKEKAESVEANDIEYRRAEAASEKKYQETLARNQAEYERKKAELDAETERKLAEYDRQRDERDAQYAKEQAERDTKQARCSSFRAEYPDVDTYKKKKGNLDELWTAYKKAEEEYTSASNAANSYNSLCLSNINKCSERQQSYNTERLQAASSKLNAARSAWTSKNISLGNEYNEQYRQACL